MALPPASMKFFHPWQRVMLRGVMRRYLIEHNKKDAEIAELRAKYEMAVETLTRISIAGSSGNDGN